MLEKGAMDALNSVEEDGLLEGIITRVGEGPVSGGPVSGPAASGSHLLTIEMELVGSENRDISATTIEQAWEQAVPPIAGLDSLTFNANIGPSGDADIEVQLTHTDYDVLIEAAGELANKLSEYSDLTGIQSSYASGKEQYNYALKPAASTLGITANDVARQLRAAFFGSEALREQRGRNEVKVLARLPREQRTSLFDLEQLRIRTPQGGYVPLAEIAVLTPTISPTDVIRENGKRVVTVSARLAPGVASTQTVVDDLTTTVFDDLRDKHAGLELGFSGSQADLGESLTYLGLYFLVALIVIFALLAIPFKSYLQPFLIMFGAIPMGIVGAIWGHIFLGYELSMVSMFGIVALSGVVINDSLVLIDAANSFRRKNMDADPLDAIIWAGTRRLRPILLTSLTTFFGLMPLIFETSVQAKFIIPMAISLGFGILFGTVVILILVPSLYLILEDLIWSGQAASKWVFGESRGDETPSGKMAQ